MSWCVRLPRNQGAREPSSEPAPKAEIAARLAKIVKIPPDLNFGTIGNFDSRVFSEKLPYAEVSGEAEKPLRESLFSPKHPSAKNANSAKIRPTVGSPDRRGAAVVADPARCGGCGKPVLGDDRFYEYDGGYRCHVDPECMIAWNERWHAAEGREYDAAFYRQNLIPVGVIDTRPKPPGCAGAPMAHKIARWADDNLAAIGEADPAIPDQLNDRAADVWSPLLAIADVVGGEWPDRAREAAVELSGGDGATETTREMLLYDIRAAFDAEKADRLASEALVSHLTEIEGRPWPEFRGGRPISKTQVARLLNPLGISSGTIRLADDRTPKGYYRSAFEDAFARYLSSPLDVSAPPPSNRNATTPQPRQAAGFSENHAATRADDVAFQNPEKPSVSAACGVVADGIPGKAPKSARVMVRL